MTDNTVDTDLKTMQQITACGYDPIERKGHGTYGFVYEVGDVKGDLYAFKYILPDPKYEQVGLQSLNEIDILSRVHHPHIIHAAQILTAHNCQIDGLAVILPLADRTLFDIITNPTITTEYKLPILYKLASALEFMHRANILHLDIKSTNVVLQGTHPYFIDFGLSMVVPNVTTGIYEPSLRVTIDHRAPEIVAGGRVYNAAVDVWAFGIMMLYVISSRNIFNLDFSQPVNATAFHELQLQLFSNPQTIPNLLVNVAPKYRALATDLLTRTLQIDPTKRLTAKQITEHPLFDSVRIPIDGFLDNSPINPDYPDDHREILKIMIHWIQSLYPKSSAQMLFLAVDLYARTSSAYKEATGIERMNLAATCLWMATKLTNAPNIKLSDYVANLVKMVPGIDPKHILKMEIHIIHLLKGDLNVSQLYTACRTGDELRLSYENIILNKDSTLYARTDIPAWINVMQQYITTPTYPKKEITVTELMS